LTMSTATITYPLPKAPCEKVNLSPFFIHMSKELETLD
jgi:hypothetical protein